MEINRTSIAIQYQQYYMRMHVDCLVQFTAHRSPILHIFGGGGINVDCCAPTQHRNRPA